MAGAKAKPESTKTKPVPGSPQARESGRRNLNSQIAKRQKLLLAGIGAIALMGGGMFIFGNDGDDTLFGGAGLDELFGDTGNDLLSGGNSSDRLIGGIGNDTLLGETGNDVLNGGGGIDRLSGGSGADQFVFVGDLGQNLVTDFEEDVDSILIGGFTESDVTVATAGDDVVLLIDGGGLARIQDGVTDGFDFNTDVFFV